MEPNGRKWRRLAPEADPRYAVQELWDPGIARVQVALYQFEPNYFVLATNNAASKQTVYGLPYDVNFWKIKILRPGATYPRLADVDNYPFGWATGGLRGPEDFFAGREKGGNLGGRRGHSIRNATVTDRRYRD